MLPEYLASLTQSIKQRESHALVICPCAKCSVCYGYMYQSSQSFFSMKNFQDYLNIFYKEKLVAILIKVPFLSKTF